MCQNIYLNEFKGEINMNQMFALHSLLEEGWSIGVVEFNPKDKIVSGNTRRKLFMRKSF